MKSMVDEAELLEHLFFPLTNAFHYLMAVAMKVGDVESRAIHTHSNWTPEVTKIIYIPHQSIEKHKEHGLSPKRGPRYSTALEIIDKTDRINS